MQRIHRASYVPPHEPYRLIKRFRHEEELGYEPVKWHKSIYDQDEGHILGSSPFRWLTRIIYFICFYSGVCLYWYILYTIFLTTVPEEQPKYFIQNAPGMSLAPHIQPLSVPFITYRDKKDVEIDPYTKDIDHFLSKYGALYEDYGNCQAKNEYGYKEQKPCFFVKLNRIIGFHPITYNSVYELPYEAPDELKTLLTNLPDTNRTSRVWLTCNAERNAETSFEYWPKHQSVPASLLTVPEKIAYDDGSFYNSFEYERVIAVQISGFNLDERFKIHCYAWAKNIDQLNDGHGFRGCLTFTMNVKKALYWSVL